MTQRSSRHTLDGMATSLTSILSEIANRPWLDAEQVAPYLCTTAHTLRRLARDGNCPIVVRRIGGRWWFSRVDLCRFLDGIVPEDEA